MADVEQDCESFKSIEVGKLNNLEKEIGKLRDGKLKDHWNKRKYKEFLERFKCIIEGKKLLTVIDKTLPFLPELGYSFDLNVHKGICECYSKLLDLYEKDRLFHSRAGSAKRILPRSINRYVDNVLCTKREKICPDIQRLLMFLSKNDCEEQTLKVEEELCLIFQKQKGFPVSRVFRTKYVLQQIALNFMDKLYVYPLASKFPKRPGVYFIYHVGKTQLYEGSQVSPSTRNPVYVGMSQTSIADRLRDHLRKVNLTSAGKKKSTASQQTEGKKIRKIKTSAGKKKSTASQQTKGMKLELTDFVVRFMIVQGCH